MALVYDGTVKRLTERLDDLEGEVFGPAASAYRLHQKLTGVEPLSTATVLAPGAGTPRTLAAMAGDVVNALSWGMSPTASAADNSAALADAISKAATGPGIVYVPGGTYNHEGFALRGGVHVIGAGPSRTILNYTGTGSAVTNPTPGTRIYRNGLRDLWLSTSTGAIGIDLDSVSEGRFESVLVTGFSDAGVDIHSTVDGGAVYNRFFNVKAQSCATGFRLRASSSNANVFVACRANICSARGWDIQDVNDNSVIASQAEACGVGIYLASPSGAGYTDWNRIRDCRLENNTTGLEIGANVRNTIRSGLWLGSNGTNISDSGTTTRRDDLMSVNSLGNAAVFETGLSIFSGNSIFLGAASAAISAYTNASLHLRGDMPNTGAAVGTWLGNSYDLDASGAKVIGFCRDTPVTHAVPLAYIDNLGNYENAIPGEGVIIASPNGTRHKITVSDAGALVVTPL